MHFTREPIIESVVTARDGYKLTVRSTNRGTECEEYTVEAVEIVSFGKTQFFRSLEKPRPFLLPVNDFEVLETKETRVLFKGTSFEKSIKIGGGRESPIRKEQQPVREGESLSHEEGGADLVRGAASAMEARRKDRKTHRRRRANEERTEMKEWSEKKRLVSLQPLQTEEKPIAVEGGSSPATGSFIGTLIPPPTTLISESLMRYKEALILEPLSDEHVNEPPPIDGKDNGKKKAVRPRSMHSEDDGASPI